MFQAFTDEMKGLFYATLPCFRKRIAFWEVRKFRHSDRLRRTTCR